MIDSAFRKLMVILDQLQEAGIAYSLNRAREDTIMIAAAAPGERWEIEVLIDGTIEVEVFRSEGMIFDECKIKELIGHYSDRIPCAPVKGASTREGQHP
jgi:hypothetical protein